MTSTLQSAWNALLRPLMTKPKRQQMAAICYRHGDEGRQVLLITSRDTGRWIVPKGWPIKGLSGAETALQEAWEEAGVKAADVGEEPIGTYDYTKELKSGASTRVRTDVYLAQVKSLAKTYPEATQRTRKWVSSSEAANLVKEPELKDILRRL